MKAEISVIFPHADNAWNNELYELNKQMLKENTRCKYELLTLWNNDRDYVYPAWNALAKLCKADVFVWSNTDVLFAPDWDVNVLKYINQTDYCGIWLVECGSIGVHENNIDRNFGRTAKTFRRAEFEDWVKVEGEKFPETIEKFSWYSPSAFKKDWFLKRGGFPTDEPFPAPNDARFVDKMKEDKCKFLTVKSFAYHLQYARENTGEKEFSETR